MKIPIGDYFLFTDKTQFIIAKEVTNKKGDKSYKGHRYYESIERAMEGFLRLSILQSEATTLKQLVNDINEAKRFILDTMNLIER